MYDAVADEYCYPGTQVLKNKLDIRDADELEAFHHRRILLCSRRRWRW